MYRPSGHGESALKPTCTHITRIVVCCRIQCIMHIICVGAVRNALGMHFNSLYITSAPCAIARFAAHLAICTIDQSIHSKAPRLPAHTHTHTLSQPPPPPLPQNRQRLFSGTVAHAHIVGELPLIPFLIQVLYAAIHVYYIHPVLYTEYYAKWRTIYFFPNTTPLNETKNPAERTMDFKMSITFRRNVLQHSNIILKVC